jgi:hypothetical protein
MRMLFVAEGDHTAVRSRRFPSTLTAAEITAPAAASAPVKRPSSIASLDRC